MDWERDLPTWPLNHISRRIRNGPHRWHVQEMGTGDILFLLHGAGATTHSWRDIIPLLAKSHRVIAIDLPGHGFTQIGTRGRSGLKPMIADIAALCGSEGWMPAAIIGHSAGAAVALGLALEFQHRDSNPPDVIGVNAALGRFEGIASWLFPLLAKLLALNPLTPYIFSAGRNTSARARRLIEGTGSVLTDEGIAFYARLIASRSHVEGTLKMMAQWEIDALIDSLPSLRSRCLLLAGENDTSVKPSVSERAASLIPDVDFLRLPNLGHLAHEERPDEFTEKTLGWLDS